MTQGALYAPSEFKTVAKQIAGYVQETRPLGERMRITIERQMAIFACVVVLRGPTSPDAIFSRVWTVVVKALDRVSSSWTWPHVQKKGGEVIAPSFADFYASAAVIGERHVLRISTARFQGGPRPVLGGFAKPVFQIVSMRVSTSTRSRVSANKMRCLNGAFLSAVTTAKKIASSACNTIGLGQYCPSIEPRTYRDRWRHSANFTMRGAA